MTQTPKIKAPLITSTGLISLVIVGGLCGCGQRHHETIYNLQIAGTSFEPSSCYAELKGLRADEDKERQLENDLFPKLSNRQYIEMLYRRLLNRKGDKAGIDNWTDWLERGATRVWIAGQFIASPEFRNVQ